MIFSHMDKIVFAGDSVTDMESMVPVGEGMPESLGKGYVRIIDNLLGACYPKQVIRVTNSGISGNTSRDLLKRFERDVVRLKPDWVSVCIGINDVWRQFDMPAIPEAHVYPEEYRDNVEQMIQMVKGRVKGVFLMTPYYMEPNLEDPMRKRMEEYRQICASLAREHGCIFIDLQEMFDQYFCHRHSSFIAWDRVHPNYVGATLIAKAFLSHCDFCF